MKLLGYLTDCVALWMKQNGYDVKITPNVATTYTAARTIQIPPGNTDQIIMSADSTATMTNKTFDADGTGNSITNIEDADIKAGAAIARSKMAAGTASHVVINDGSGNFSSEATLAKSRGGTGADMSSVTFPASGTLATLAGTEVLENKSLEATCALVDTTDNTKTIKWNLAAQSTGVDLTITSSAETADRVITIPVLGTDQELVFKDLAQTLTQKTLTSPTISGGSVNNATIGNSVRNTGAFTTLGANSTSTLADIISTKDYGAVTSADNVASSVQADCSFSGAQTGSLTGFYASSRIGGSGSTSDTDPGSSAISALAVTQNSVSVNTLIGVRARAINGGSGTVDTAIAIKAEAPTNVGGGTLTTARSILATGITECQDDLYMSNNQPIKFFEATGGGSNAVSLQSAAALAADYTVTLPSSTTVLVGRDPAGQSLSFVAEDNASTVTLDNANFEVENTDGTQHKFTITSAKVGDTTVTLQENFTIGDGADVTITAEDAAGTITLDNSSFEVENTAGAGQTVKIINAKAAAGATVTLNEDLTIADGADVSIQAVTAATTIIMDNATFTVDNDNATQRNIKITSDKAGDTVLSLKEDLSVGDGASITITAEDNSSSVVLDNANFEVENTDGTQHKFTITSAKVGDTTVTLQENFTIGDGADVTITAEDAAGTITLDNSSFEVENTVGAGQTLKLINTTAGPGAATLSISGTTGAINQDVQSTATPTFANIQTGSNGEVRFMEGANYVGFEAPALSADQIWVLPDTDGTAGQTLTTDGAGNLSWGAGSGAGGINYILNSDAEGGTTGWAEYADAAAATPADGTGGSPNVTWTRNTTTPLRGAADFLYTKDAADRQGEGVSYDFTIDSADIGKQLSISFDVDATDADYVAGDLVVYIYDVDNSALITPSFTSIAAAKYKWQAYFSTSTANDYRLIIHQATTNASALTIYFDNVQVGPEEQIQITPTSDWTSYTPTFGGLGTVTNISIEYKRVGDTLSVRGSFTTGTVSGSNDATMTLPSGLTISVPHANAQTCGFRFQADASASFAAVLAVDGSTHFDFGAIDLAANATMTHGQNGDVVFNSNKINTIQIYGVKIAEWSGSSVGLANSRVEYASVAGTWDAASTTTVYGPGGAIMGGALTASREKTITWLTPVQPTDKFEIQVSVDRVTWHNINNSIIGASYNTPVNQTVTAGGSSLNGSGCYLKAGGTSTSIVTFALYASMANDDSPAVDWPNDTYWRVVKSSNPLSIGMPTTIKWQRKDVTSNVTSSGDVAALEFTVETGKTYRLSGQLTYALNTGGSDDLAFADILDGATALARPYVDVSSTGASFHSVPVSIIYTATSTSLSTNLQSASANSYLVGSGTDKLTYLILEELPYHVQTTSW